MDISEDDARDELLTNGMLERYEKRLVAVRSTKTDCNKFISKEKRVAPDTEYCIEGTSGHYFVSQIWYIPAYGSDAESNQYDQEEIALHNENMRLAIEQEQMTMIREAFPEGW